MRGANGGKTDSHIASCIDAVSTLAAVAHSVGARERAGSSRALLLLSVNQV